MQQLQLMQAWKNEHLNDMDGGNQNVPKMGT